MPVDTLIITVLLTTGIGLVGYIGVGMTKRISVMETRLATQDRRIEQRHLETSERLTRIETLLGEENGRRLHRGREGC